MKAAHLTVTLSPENSKAVTKLAALIGSTPGELANHLLVEALLTVNRQH